MKKISLMLLTLLVLGMLTPVFITTAEPRMRATKGGPPSVSPPGEDYWFSDGDTETPWGIDRIFARAADDLTSIAFDELEVPKLDNEICSFEDTIPVPSESKINETMPCQFACHCPVIQNFLNCC